LSNVPLRIKFLGRGPRQRQPEIWRRQIPGGGPEWGGRRFLFAPDDTEYDWLAVYDDLPAGAGERFSTQRERLRCPRERTLLITTEPSSIKVYGRAYLSQFGHVLSSQEAWAIRHPGHIHAQPALRWFYGLGKSHMRTYDEIAANPPLEKPGLIAAVCSSKRQRHTLHNLRYRFTFDLKERMPELEIFGHGVRDMDDKAESVDPFKYHVAVENHVAPHHWTEKLADAFLGCALPFYFGAPNAADYFPTESFIPIDIRRPDEAARIMREAIESGQYERRLPHILEARRRVLEEHNLFAVVGRIAEDRHALPAGEPGGVLRSRRSARRSAPLSAVADLVQKARIRFGRPSG
jgi:hypothetical protein